jgi:hypothetical protein
VTTNILVGGSDLDTLLMPRGAHTAISNVNIQSNGGVDLSQRFAGVAFGTPFGTTNIKSAGVDIGTLFARIAISPTIYTLTAANFSGFDIGYVNGVGGSISPNTFVGLTITQLYTQDTGVAANDTFTLSAASNPGANLFTSIAVSGGQTRTSVTATYGYTSGVATWFWGSGATGTGLFNSVTTYTVTIS